MTKIKSEQVPKAAITALRGLTCCGCDKCLSKAIAAALNAWPGMEFSKHLSVRDDATPTGRSSNDEGLTAMTDIHIPPAALEAGARADFEFWRDWHRKGEMWEELEPDVQDGYRAVARAAFLAMLKAWPDSILMPVELILPLPTQENGDE